MSPCDGLSSMEIVNVVIKVVGNSTHNTEICKTCDKIFKTKNYLRYHRKKEHIINVRVCLNGNNCWYGERCWFRHELNKVRNYEEKTNMK